MGCLRNHIPDPDKKLDRPGMTTEQLFATMRNLVMSDQIDHYYFFKNTIADIIIMSLIIFAGAGFVLFLWGFLPRILS